MIRIGNAPVSWGVIENVAGERQTYDQVLDEIRQSGYAGTELGDWGFLPTDPESLKAELAARNLDLMAAFVPVALSQAAAHEPGAANAVRTAKLHLRARRHACG